MKKRILSFALILALLLSLLPFTAFAGEADQKFNDSVELYFDGEPGWRVYPVESIDDALTLEQLNIELRTKDGDVVDPSLYTLSIKVQTGWDEENNCPITGDTEAPYGIEGEVERMQGFQSYYVYVEAKEGSGYEGDMTCECIIWDEHSFNWFGATTDFGEQYKSNSTWFWHDYYKIPKGRISAPDVYSISKKPVDPSQYTITYFERNTELPDFDDPDYQEIVFPEDDPLDEMPTEEGAYFAKIEAKEDSLYYGTSYVDFDIVTIDLSDDYRILVDSEEWKDVFLDSVDDTVSLEELNITVSDRDGRIVPSDAYDLSFAVELGWDNENDCPITEEAFAPFGFVGENNRNDGYCQYTVTAQAKEDSGYIGSPREAEFALNHKYSLEHFPEAIDFGENFRRNGNWSWHLYFKIPVGNMRDPEIYDKLGNPIDPEYYTLTYFERNTDLPDRDDPEYDQKLFPEDQPLSEMPTEEGSYFVRLEAKAPYYGTTYADFDIVVPDSYVTIRNAPRSFSQGDTIFIPEDGEVWIWFEVDPDAGDLIAGWNPDSLDMLSISQDPEYFEDEGIFVKVSAEGAPLGTRETLDYGFYRVEDIFGEDAVGWAEAEPVFTSSIDFEIGTEPDPETFMFFKDENGRYFDGDTATVYNGEKLLLCFDLTYYPDFLLCDSSLDDLKDKGFYVDDRFYQFEEAGYVYKKIRVEGLEAGTRAAIPYTWYGFDDYISGDKSNPVYSGAVYLEVADRPEGFTLGDADSDGKVTILDATTIQKKLASNPITPFCAPAADANRNGVLEILDATNIQKYLAHIELPDQQELDTPGVYGTYYAAWNIEEKLLPEDSGLEGADAYEAEANIRKALALLIDRTAVLKNAGLERKAASSFVSDWITEADGTEFETNTDQGVSYGYFDPSKKAYQSNYETAVAILKQYYDYDEETGKFTNIPTLSYLFNEGEVHRAIAETIQSCYAELGIELELDERGWGEYYDVIASKDYSFCRGGWVVDFDDPHEFLSMWTSVNEDNIVGFGLDAHRDVRVYTLDLTSYGYDICIHDENWLETYDTLNEVIEQCRNREIRYRLMHLAEDMVMDTGCIIPLYYY